MTYAKALLTEVETVIPYGNSTGLLHLRFNGDYKTFCGRECEGWPISDKRFSETVDSSYCCKRCRTAAFK